MLGIIEFKECKTNNNKKYILINYQKNEINKNN